MKNPETTKFLIFYQDVNNEDTFTPELINELTKQHVEHLRNLDSKGALFLCGPMKDDERGMLILNAKNYEEAESYVKQDPFIVNNCYTSYVIKEIIEGNASNNYLLEEYLM